MQSECGHMGVLEGANLAGILLEDCIRQNCCATSPLWAGI